MYQRILVATDGSELSRKATDSAVALGASLGASVVALRVVAPYPISYFEGAMAIDMKEITRIEEGWAAAAKAELDEVKAAGQAKGVAVTTLVAHADVVAETVIAQAAKHQCDLIVMASHGRRGMARMLLGSETQHVLTHSHIPVLVLR